MDPMSFIVQNLAGAMQVPPYSGPRRVITDGHEKAAAPRPKRRSKPKVYKRPPGTKPRRTRAEIEHIVSLHLAGATKRELAERFDLHPKTIREYVRVYSPAMD